MKTGDYVNMVYREVTKLKGMDSFIDSSKKLYGYIDESGGFGFDFEEEGVSSYYLITAILVEENLAASIEKEVMEVRSNFFQNGEMKSSKVGKNHQRRMLILENLKGLDFKILTVVVDKRRIILSCGLKYKKSYIKYLNGLLYEELHNYFPKLELHADEHGSKEFMDGFKKYLAKEHIPNLLGEYDFGFGNSKSEVLIQLADFICGTIALGFENEGYKKEDREYMDILQDKLLPIIYWPFELEDYVKKLDQYKGNTFDKNIAYNSIKLATKYIESNTKRKDSEVQERVYELKNFLSMLISQDPNKYISTKEIINNLFELTGRDYTAHYFKTRIIAKLRDAGVLISSTQSGYKIPIREKEILAFVNQTSSMVKPMLERLNICRNRVLSATGNDFDVLDFREFEYLKLFLDREK